ncbi:flagellar motor switch protein FliG [Polymorphobacter multimanifer]|uniref:FliG C-terminal domain-containing protein n=1 Tax=Polymorphobacter multimanifer TaxID=1070431 RepID=UPI00166DD71E|nr:FliG C-terminal domain-containing protein [Polymorphobacter multimanifer]GGI89389.1 flagellar motor switch protein FliG [Polymorphobacter multimanifer]
MSAALAQMLADGTAPPPAAVLTGAQKCAILLLLLEEAQAAELLRRLSAAEVRSVGEAMLTVAEIAPATVDAVLDEFLARTRTVEALDAQGREARARIGLALGSPRAERVIEAIGPPAAVKRLAGLDWLDSAAVAGLIADEHPQVVAVVLAHLETARAAAVLDALPATLQTDAVLRLATLGPVAPAEVAALEADLDAKLAERTRSEGAVRLAGKDFTAALVNLSANQAALIAALAAVDADLAGAIAESSFGFNDLSKLAPRELQLVLRELDQAVPTVALKGATPSLRELVFAAMSSRAADQLRDQLAETGPTKKADVAAAQAEVCALVRRLGEAGTVMMPGATGYV